MPVTVSIIPPFTYGEKETATISLLDRARQGIRIQILCAFNFMSTTDEATYFRLYGGDGKVELRTCSVKYIFRSQYLACMFSLDMNANSNGAFLFRCLHRGSGVEARGEVNTAPSCYTVSKRSGIT